LNRQLETRAPAGDTGHGLTRNVPRFYLFNALYLSNVWAPIYVYFLVDRGLPLERVLQAGAVWWVALMIAEVPSGALADNWGRRNSIIAGSCLLIFALALMIYVRTLATLIVVNVCWATAISFISGADSALLYDTLAAVGRESEYRRVFGYALSFGMLAGAAGSFLGGALGGRGLVLPLVMSVSLAFAQCAAALSFTEPPRASYVSVAARGSTLLRGLRIAVSGKELRLIILCQAALAAGLWIFRNELYPPYLKISGLTWANVGLVVAGFGLARAAGSAVSERVRGLMAPERQMWFAALFISGLLLTVLYTGGSLSPVPVLVALFLHGITTPIFSEQMNVRVGSHARATVVSVASLTRSLVTAAAVFFLGTVLPHLQSQPAGTGVAAGNYRGGFVLVSVICLAGSIPALLLLRHLGTGPARHMKVKGDELCEEVMIHASKRKPLG